MQIDITRPSLITNIWLYLFCTLFVVLMILLVLMLITAKNYTLTVKDDRLIIKSLFYTTNISTKDIDIANLKKIDLNTTNIKIKYKLNGIGIPGISIGWFKSKDKKYKLYLTSKSDILYIPTNLGYDILFSTTESQKIINLLKS